MRRLITAATFLAVLGAAAAGAHEGHLHRLMGTVKAVHADRNHVEVTTMDGKASGFYVTTSTKYLRGKAAGSRADLKPGSRVVVETKMEGGKAIATTVKLSGPASSKTAAPAADPR